MKTQGMLSRILILVFAIMLFVPTVVFGQNETKKVFSQEELDQMLSPIALYPDSLLTQVRKKEEGPQRPEAFGSGQERGLGSDREIAT